MTSLRMALVAQKVAVTLARAVAVESMAIDSWEGPPGELSTNAKVDSDSLLTVMRRLFQFVS